MRNLHTPIQTLSPSCGGGVSMTLGAVLSGAGSAWKDLLRQIAARRGARQGDSQTPMK